MGLKLSVINLMDLEGDIAKLSKNGPTQPPPATVSASDRCISLLPNDLQMINLCCYEKFESV